MRLWLARTGHSGRKDRLIPHTECSMLLGLLACSDPTERTQQAQQLRTHRLQCSDAPLQIVGKLAQLVHVIFEGGILRYWKDCEYHNALMHCTWHS